MSMEKIGLKIHYLIIAKIIILHIYLKRTLIQDGFMIMIYVMIKDMPITPALN